MVKENSSIGMALTVELPVNLSSNVPEVAESKVIVAVAASTLLEGALYALVSDWPPAKRLNDPVNDPLLCCVKMAAYQVAAPPSS